MSSSGRLEAVAVRSGMVCEALAMARRLHAGMTRDLGEDVPFLRHPLAVGELLAEHELDEETIAAGLLHDTLEYTDLDLGVLRERFGMRVAMLVCALTEDLEIVGYEERKTELRERVAATGIDGQRVFAADKIANVIEARDDYVLKQEDIDLGQEVDLDRKILAWEYDLEMLIASSEEEPLFELLPDELVGLWDQRCTQMRAEEA